MEVILLKDVLHCGFKDDIVNVKNGFARNYLIPKGLAVVANDSSKKVLAEIRKGLDPYTYDYWWENDDDLLIFDNSIVQHRRLGDTTNRLCHRYQFDYTYLQYKLN